MSEVCVERVYGAWKCFEDSFGAFRQAGNVSRICLARLEKLEIF